jgi:uncharacterized protein YndB with AHSA1/START domain
MSLMGDIGRVQRISASRIEVRAVAVSSATAEEVYSLLCRSATYPLWSMIQHLEAVRSGRHGIDGVGAIRQFKTGLSVMREEIVDAVAGKRIAYILLSGFPLLDYQADTTLEPVHSGTRITWSSTFRPR